MPNWCDTTYKCVGESHEVQSLFDILQKLRDNAESRVPNGFGHLWLGNVIDALGGDWEKFRCRGEITDFYMDDEVLVINQETAWCEQEGVRYFLQAKFPSIKIYYIEEEPGCEVYCTNDDTGLYFSDRYILDGDDGGYEYYRTLEEVCTNVTNLTGQEVHTLEEITKALDAYNEHHEDDDKYCYFHEFKYVSE